MVIRESVFSMLMLFPGNPSLDKPTWVCHGDLGAPNKGQSVLELGVRKGRKLVSVPPPPPPDLS